MTTRIDPTATCRDMDLLHPHARKQFQELAAYLIAAHTDKDTRSLFLPFETYRYPQRQRMLFNTTKSTKADMYQSSHQLGMAVDFVAFRDNLWSWAESEDWSFLRAASLKFRLAQPISWDRPHIEHPKWQHIVLDLKDARMW
jgi:hypothetical protein